jgi:hypothetical protein
MGGFRDLHGNVVAAFNEKSRLYTQWDCRWFSKRGNQYVECPKGRVRFLVQQECLKMIFTHGQGEARVRYEIAPRLALRVGEQEGETFLIPLANCNQYKDPEKILPKQLGLF